jgi:Ca2+-binding RTX toxin-like protein
MATINGTNSADTLYGTSGADSIFGFNGNDTLKGGGGADRLGDTYVSIESVYGSSFNDTITGDDANNTLYGLDGADVLKGGGGYDYLEGGSGNDILKGGGGADWLNGGSGIDTADYSQAAASSGPFGVIIHLDTNVAYYGEAEGDMFTSIENVTGSIYHDDLHGNEVNNVLRGLDGIDKLYGNGGDDVLDGGNDNDVLDGGAGIDTMTGGTGDDTYYVDNASDVVNESAGQPGYDQVWSSTSYALSATTEIEFMYTADQNTTTAINFTGNDFNQHITGNAGANVLSGGGGNDNLSGREGNDTLLGGIGDDLFFGHDGADTMTGGSGLDNFVYYRADETGTLLGTMDIITDFNRAEGDVLHFGQMDANLDLPGNENWTFVGTAGLTAAGQCNVSFFDGDTFIGLKYSANASATFIQIEGLHTVDASWFVL